MFGGVRKRALITPPEDMREATEARAADDQRWVAKMYISATRDALSADTTADEVVIGETPISST